jgi:hypothetical protein
MPAMRFGKSVDQTLTIVLKDVIKEVTTGTTGSDTVAGASVRISSQGLVAMTS